MKKFIIKAMALIAVSAMSACSEDAIVENNLNSNDSDFLQEISITGKNFQFDETTRSSVIISEGGASFAWDEDDVIGIFPNTGDQVSFAMKNGAGTQTATFSGGGWALKSSAKYAAYYPHVYENRDMTAIPVSYLGQTQNGNNNTDHIGAYDFMAANVTTPSNGAVAFDMQHLGCLVQLKIDLDEAASIQNVSIKLNDENDRAFSTIGYIDLTSVTLQVVAEEESKANCINVITKNLQVAKEETAIVYFMMAPTNVDGKELEIKIEKADRDVVKYKVVGKNYVAGKTYSISLSHSNEKGYHSWFNPNQYITYVENYERYWKGDNCYNYSSYFDCPISGFSKIELKYQMKDAASEKIYLCCRNRAKDNTGAIYFNSNGLYFDYDDYDDDDCDLFKNYSYAWEELNVNNTDLMTLTISFKDEYMEINGNDLEYKMHAYNSFFSHYFFTYYFGESDEGYWLNLGEGVPEGSKLYYIKVWDEKDDLIYLGAASIALNPKTNEMENCWRSYYNGENIYEFAYYPTTNSSYTPFGGGVD